MLYYHIIIIIIMLNNDIIWKKLEYAQFLNIFYKLFADKFCIYIPSRTNETLFFDMKSILFPLRHRERDESQKADSLVQL